MGIVKKCITLIKQPWRLAASAKLHFVSKLLPDKLYLYCMYRTYVGGKPNFDSPVTYNEKLQWLKLHDRDTRYIGMVDKYEAKRFAAERIGEEHIVNTYGVWNSFDEIDFDSLPNSFVLKCTHDSAGNVICRDKSTFDRRAAEKKIKFCLSRNYFYMGREWVYKNIPPRIIAEEYMEDSTLGELRDYKFFTFGGKAHFMHLVSNRQNKDEATYGDFFDMEYNHMELTMGHDNAPIMPEKPKNFELMKKYAEILSEGTVHLRVDFYEVNGRLYFGELTFFQDSGFADIQPKSLDTELGGLIDLSLCKTEN